MELFLGIPIWLLFGILGAWIATTKGRSGCGWFLLCSLLGPFGLILAAVVPKKSLTPSEPLTPAEARREPGCPIVLPFGIFPEGLNHVQEARNRGLGLPR